MEISDLLALGIQIVPDDISEYQPVVFYGRRDPFAEELVEGPVTVTERTYIVAPRRVSSTTLMHMLLRIIGESNNSVIK